MENHHNLLRAAVELPALMGCAELREARNPNPEETLEPIGADTTAIVQDLRELADIAID